jgi:hypothetical protein
MNLYLIRREKMSEVYSRKFVGDDIWVYVIETESGYDVYETKYSGNDDYLESFPTLTQAVSYADNLC